MHTFKTVHDFLVSSAQTIGACNTRFDAVNMHRLTRYSSADTITASSGPLSPTPKPSFSSSKGNRVSQLLTMATLIPALRSATNDSSAPCATSQGRMHILKLSVGVPRNANLLEIEGLFTQGSRPGRSFNKPVGGTFEVDSSDWYWLYGIRYHIFDTRSDTEL